MNRIRHARKTLGWSQEELAQRAHVSTRTVHAVETGLSCRQSTKRQILSALGVSFALRSEFFPKQLSRSALATSQRFRADDELRA